METLSSVSYYWKRWDILKQWVWRIFSTWLIYCGGGCTDHFIQQPALLADTWHLPPATRWQDHSLLGSAVTAAANRVSRPCHLPGAVRGILALGTPRTTGAALTSLVGPRPSVWLVRVECCRTICLVPWGCGGLRHTNDNSSFFFMNNTVELACILIFIFKQSRLNLSRGDKGRNQAKRQDDMAYLIPQATDGLLWRLNKSHAPITEGACRDPRGCCERIKQNCFGGIPTYLLALSNPTSTC